MKLAEHRALFTERATARAAASGAAMGDRAAAACERPMLWVFYLRAHRQTYCAYELLDGARAAMLESVAYCGVGLGRAAITAMRTQIELLLSFTYFGSHPEEWQFLVETGEGFKLKKEIDEYHIAHNKRFKSRLGLIEQAADLSLKQVYKIACAHVHGQSALTIPKAGNFEELINSEVFMESVVQLQEKVSDAIGNFLLALYADEWAAIPDKILEKALSLMTDAQRMDFFRPDHASGPK